MATKSRSAEGRKGGREKERECREAERQRGREAWRQVGRQRDRDSIRELGREADRIKEGGKGERGRE